MEADTLWMEIGDTLRGRYHGREILWKGDTLWREILCGGRYPGEGDTLGREIPWEGDILGQKIPWLSEILLEGRYLEKRRYPGYGDTLGREISCDRGTVMDRCSGEGDTLWKELS